MMDKLASLRRLIFPTGDRVPPRRFSSENVASRENSDIDGNSPPSRSPGNGSSGGGLEMDGSFARQGIEDKAGVYLSTPPDHDHACTTKARQANVAPDTVRLGLACMAKKMKSPTMQAFIEKFESFGNFTVVQFAEDMLLNDPVDEWPNVDCAIMFFSSGFPLDKACEYYNRHRRDTYFLTEPESQKVLLDRRDFYRALSHNNIPLPPNHLFCNRDGYRGEPDSILEEGDDHIIIDGQRLDKPFVEKPVDSEDHEVFIYYSNSMGGGCRKMFRKVKNMSSCFDPSGTHVRRNGSFLYESFVPTAHGTDVKCYTVGPNFVHAEARKAPAVDGVVDRDEKGKERRVQVQLTPAELMVARKVIKVFRQMVCGFDLLRVSDEEFYVCDVNGWSFVKNNPEYVERAARIMRDIFLDEVGRRGLHRLFKRTASMRELVGVVGVYRHADRTPKQKLKLVVNSKRLFDVAFEGPVDGMEEVVFKGEHPKLAALEPVVLEELAACDASAESPGADCVAIARRREVLALMSEVLSRRHEGLKLQVKPKKLDAEGYCVEAQLVCKWGGWLTAAGERQAQNVGQHFVERVFGNECGTLYLKDVQVVTNNERRVIATAKHFVNHVTHRKSNSFSVDEKLLGDNSVGKEELDELCTHVSTILHIDDPAKVDEVRNLPGMNKVLESFVLDDDERTPFGAMKKLHTLVASLVDHVHNSWRNEPYPLYRNESVRLLRQRWANLMKSFVLRSPDQPGEGPVFDVSKLTDIFDYASYDVCYNQRAFSPVDLYPLFTLAQTLSAFVSESEWGIDSAKKSLAGALVGQPLLTRIYTDLVAMASGNMPRTRLYFTSASHVNALRHVLYNSTATTFHNIGTPLELHFLSHFVFKLYRYPSNNTPANERNQQAADIIAASLEGHSPEGTISGHALNLDLSPLGGDNSVNTENSTLSLNGEPSQVFQMEVHFSTGVDKNMFGIVQGHHMSYGAVSPMIRIHNNLTFKQLYDIVQQCQKAYVDRTAISVNPVSFPRSLRTPITPKHETVSGTTTPARLQLRQEKSVQDEEMCSPTTDVVVCFPQSLSPNTMHGVQDREEIHERCLPIAHHDAE
jgi:inositol hexakisphosphate/diphosphoinositol-pentakisphosphate kinase